MEETHLDKKTPHKQGREEKGKTEKRCISEPYFKIGLFWIYIIYTIIIKG